MANSNDDDFYIALAALHGAVFYKDVAGRYTVDDGTGYYTDRLHQIEIEHGSLTNIYSFISRAEAARAWCKFYKLISENDR